VSRLVIQVDNKSTVSLMKNPVHHDRSKHINIRYHLTQDFAYKKLIEVKFIR
jgi:hypothetical protein